jgi:hypothetical protein
MNHFKMLLTFANRCKKVFFSVFKVSITDLNMPPNTELSDYGRLRLVPLLVTAS